MNALTDKCTRRRGNAPGAGPTSTGVTMNKTKDTCRSESCDRCNVPVTHRGPNNARYKGGRRLTRLGYVQVLAPDGHPRRTTNQSYVLEHRLVMEEHLGRYLLQHEAVHHLNGDRSDNRIENLELWSKCQPAGQRVTDKVAWAREILALYGHLDPEVNP